MVRLGNKIGDVPSYDMYNDLISSYQDNVGGCWSWEKGSSGDYCSTDSGSMVLLRGWMILIGLRLFI